MWTLLAVGVVASIAFGLAAVVLHLWPLTNEKRTDLT
jgi:hypothetical protein